MPSNYSVVVCVYWACNRSLMPSKLIKISIVACSFINYCWCHCLRYPLRVCVVPAIHQTCGMSAGSGISGLSASCKALRSPPEFPGIHSSRATLHARVLRIRAVFSGATVVPLRSVALFPPRPYKKPLDDGQQRSINIRHASGSRILCAY